MLLPDLLRQYRKEYRIAQKQMAAMLQISREHYSKIEEGLKIPPYLLLDKISKVLKIRLVMLFPSDDSLNRHLMEDDKIKVEVDEKDQKTFAVLDKP